MPRLMPFIAILFSTAVFAGELPIVKPESVGMSSSRLKAVDGVMNKQVADKKIAGGIVMISRNGKIAMFNTYGRMDIEADKPMQKDTIFRIYSMTKSITTAAAMILYDEGKLKPEDPASKFVPEMKGVKVLGKDGDRKPSREMTVADLMRHTAGVLYGWGGGPVDKKYQAIKPLESKNLDEFGKKLGQLPLQYEPGKDWIYSVSIDVLGLVVQRASGKRFDTFLDERIFKPLDMKDTGFHVPKSKHDRFAANYSHKLKVVDAPATSKYAKPTTFHSGGGGLVSTTRDYMRFLVMILNDGELHGTRILKKKTVAMMKTNQLPKEAFPIYFGTAVRHGTGFSYGFSVRVSNSQWDPAARIGEYGWGGAASTHYWTSPRDNLIVVTLEQRMPYTFETEWAIKKIIYDAIE